MSLCKSLALEICLLHSGSYTRTHDLLNLIKELRKRDKMRGLQCILSLFRIEFHKLNTTGARILDSIYHMALTLLKIRFFCLLLLPLWESVIVLCFVVRYFMSILVLQSS